MSGKIQEQKDQFMALFSNVSTLKINVNEIESNLNQTTRTQDLLVDRVDKLEYDNAVMKNDYEARLTNLNSNLGYVKDLYVTKYNFEQAYSNLK